MAHFFIRRPVFAWVIAIVIMLGGALAIWTLSISQYPDIAPTTVRVSATYNGASAETVEKSVTTIIEDGMTGLDDLTYMTSSSSTGSAEVTLTFGNTILPDIAQVQVQNKLQLVQSQLPDTVQQQGLQVSRSTSSILMVGALISTDGKRNSADLGDVFSVALRLGEQYIELRQRNHRRAASRSEIGEGHLRNRPSFAADFGIAPGGGAARPVGDRKETGVRGLRIGAQLADPAERLGAWLGRNVRLRGGRLEGSARPLGTAGCKRRIEPGILGAAG